MKLKISLKVFFFTLALLIVLTTIFIFSIKTIGAIGYLPFGGRITAVTICDEGFLIVLTNPAAIGKSLLGLTPLTPASGLYMLTHASIRYTPKSLVFPFTGQSILGLATPTPMACTILGIPYGKGLYIWGAGASMGVSK